MKLTFFGGMKSGRSSPVSRVLFPGCPGRRTFIQGHHCWRPRTAISEQTRERWTGRPCLNPFREGDAPLLALAPGGVCRAVSVTRDAVRSYRTVSPLPPLPKAVCFLWHFPAAHADWPLTSTLPCGARTFLPSPRPAVTGVHPDCSDRGRAYHMRSSMARFDISSAARFISRGTCTSFTRSNSLSTLSASSYSGRSEGDFTW